MQRILGYLKEKNIPKDSLEANFILEGYELGTKRTKGKIKAGDWIKVTYRLPEEGTINVIVLKERHIAFLGLYDYEGFHINGKIISNDDILCYLTLVPPNED